MLLHVVSSSAEFITPDVAASSSTPLSISADNAVVGDDTSVSSSLALSLRDIVDRRLQQENSTTTTTTSTTTLMSSYSFLQLCHKISNLPNLECECTPLVEQWQEAQQERKDLDEAYVVFDKIELQKIKCESTSPICISETTATSTMSTSNNNNNDNDVTCGRFTLDVVTANSSRDLSSSISQTTFRSCIMYTRMPSNEEPSYRDGCVQWEYYTTTTMSNNSSSTNDQEGDDTEQQGTSLQVLQQENCHVSFMNIETGTMEKCSACQVCYTNVEKQRGMNVDCDNVEPAASTTTITSTTNNVSTASTLMCHVLNLDSFFPGFRPNQAHHREQQQEQTGPTSSASCISLFNMVLLVSSMVMLWYLVTASI